MNSFEEVVIVASPSRRWSVVAVWLAPIAGLGVAFAALVAGVNWASAAFALIVGLVAGLSLFLALCTRAPVEAVFSVARSQVELRMSNGRTVTLSYDDISGTAWLHSLGYTRSISLHAMSPGRMYRRYLLEIQPSEWDESRALLSSCGLRLRDGFV